MGDGSPELVINTVNSQEIRVVIKLVMVKNAILIYFCRNCSNLLVIY